MRKALIAGIVASALFAVGAFAAVIGNVNTDNVASGEGDVGTCADLAQVEFATSAGVTPGTTTDWTVEQVTIKFTDGGTASCDGAKVDLAIGTSTDSTGPAENWIDVTTCSDADATGISTCTVSTPVRPIVAVAVLANGNEIDPDIS